MMKMFVNVGLIISQLFQAVPLHAMEAPDTSGKNPPLPHQIAAGWEETGQMTEEQRKELKVEQKEQELKAQHNQPPQPTTFPTQPVQVTETTPQTPAPKPPEGDFKPLPTPEAPSAPEPQQQRVKPLPPELQSSAQLPPSRPTTEARKQQLNNDLKQMRENPRLRTPANLDALISSYADVIRSRDGRIPEFKNLNGIFWTNLSIENHKDFIDFSKTLVEIRAIYGLLNQSLDTRSTIIQPFLDWITREEKRIPKMQDPDHKINLYRVLENTTIVQENRPQAAQYSLKIIDLLNNKVEYLDSKLKQPTNEQDRAEIQADFEAARQEIIDRTLQLIQQEVPIPTSIFSTALSYMKDSSDAITKRLTTAVGSAKRALTTKLLEQKGKLALTQATKGSITEAVKLMSDKPTLEVLNSFVEQYSKPENLNDPAQQNIRALLNNVLIAIPQAQEILNDPTAIRIFDSEITQMFGPKTFTLKTKAPTPQEVAQLADAIAQRFEEKLKTMVNQYKPEQLSARVQKIWRQEFMDILVKARVMLDSAQAHQFSKSINDRVQKLDAYKTSPLYDESLLTTTQKKTAQALQGNFDVASVVNLQKALTMLGAGEFKDTLGKSIRYEDQVKAVKSVFAVLFTVAILLPLVMVTLNQTNQL